MVYALTVCVPRKLYDNMKDDPTLSGLNIIKQAWFEDQVVHIQGKIGETLDLKKRLYQYKACSSNSGKFNA